MRQALWLCSLLVILSSFVSAKDKAIPAVIVNARYVLVTTYSGDDQTNARMMPDDRKAASDVQTALSKWGRYVVVYQPQDADIIIRIRKGRVAEALVGGKVHIGTDQPTSAGPTGTGDINTTNEDMLEVYDSHLGTDTSPLWRAFRTGGLNPPEMTLVQQLRKDVDAAAKKP